MLRIMDNKKVALLLRERRKYEVEVSKSKKEVPSMSVSSNGVSFDCVILDNMHIAGAMDDVAPNKDLSDINSADMTKFQGHDI